MSADQSFPRRLLLSVQEIFRRGHYPSVKCYTYALGTWRCEISSNNSSTEEQQQRCVLYSSAMGSTLRLGGATVDCAALSVSEISDRVQRELGFSAPSAAPADRKKLLWLWWFDRFLEDTAPLGVYSEFSEMTGFEVYLSERSTTPSFKSVEAFPQSNEGALHPFLLGGEASQSPEIGRLKAAARMFRWDEVLAIVRQDPALSNAVSADSRSGFRPLHQAAYGGASPAVVAELRALGADPQKRSVEGTPIEIARARAKSATLAALLA